MIRQEDKGTAYLFQAALILLWWTGLILNENFFSAFQFPGISSTAFYSFFAPDLILLVLLSIIRGYKTSKVIEYVILGGFAYGTLMCLNLSVLSRGGFLPSTLMLLGAGFNLFLVFQKSSFRASSSQSFGVNALKTFVQILCIWSITLFVIPQVLMSAFNEHGMTSELMKYVGLFMFVLASGLGLISAFVMVKKGKGTPLPVDQSNQLVISGPYKYVRNPMAISGLCQGVSVSIFFGSWSVLIYTLIGGLIWQTVVRPIEERNMLNRFGEKYAEYRESVSLWFPGLKAKNK